MPISPEYLPNELHYIISLADRHGSEARVAKYDAHLGRHVQYAETLTEADIEPLRQLYVKIRAKAHCPLINRWHRSQLRKDTCPSQATWAVYGLLCLFAQLGRLGIAPFDDGVVCPQEPEEPETLDWSKLPSSLRYLAGPAERFGRLQFDDPIFEFLQEQMTVDEQAELSALSRRYEQDSQAINHWLDEFSMTEHREAALVYFTGYLLAIGADIGLL